MVRGSLLLIFLAAAAVFAEDTVRVVIDTELGEIVVAVDPARAPVTADNFLRYVDAGHYDGGQFHRTVTMDNQPNNDVKIEVIQASVNEAKKEDDFSAITLERTTKTGLHHVDGTISMARDEPDSATSSFFFCIGDQPELDSAANETPTARVSPRSVASCGGWTSSRRFRCRPGRSRGSSRRSGFARFAG